MANFLIDTFTGVPGTTLASHVGETGATWVLHPTNPNGEIVLSSADRARTNAVTVLEASLYYASGVPASANYGVSSTMRVLSIELSGQLGVAGRIDTVAQTYYRFIHALDGGGAGVGRWLLGKFVSGVYTELDFSAQTLADDTDYNFELRMVDDSITGFVNGTPVCEAVDSSIATAGRAGVIGYLPFTDATGIQLSVVTATDTESPHTPSDFYISGTGDDDNDGLSPATAWATIGKMNAVGFVAGDRLFLEAGYTYSGNLLVAPVSAATNLLPILVTSYGTGRATIDCGDSYGVNVQNTGYVTVSEIHTVGSGIVVTGVFPDKDSTTTSTTGGIIWQTTTTDTWYAGNRIESVEVEGSLFGIYLISTAVGATAAQEEFSITGFNIHDCGVAGVQSRGTSVAPEYVHAPIGKRLFRTGYIGDGQIEDSFGVFDYGYDNPGQTFQSGFGVFLINAEDTVVESVFATRCGEASYNLAAGPVGIIFVESDRCIIRFCEASFIRATNKVDGEAFDFDGGCADCIAEYSYGHDCDGQGMLILGLTDFSPNLRNTVRCNIFERNGLYNRDDGSFAGGILIQDVDGVQYVYQNTFANNKSADGPAELIRADEGVFYNNIFSVGGGANFGNVNGSTLNGNVYNVRSGSTFSIVGGGTYTSLAAMQAGGLEVLGGVGTGVSGDPHFRNVLQGTQQLPTRSVSQLSAYDILTGSVAKNAGVFLFAVGVTPPSFDWHFNPRPANNTDSGAVVFGSRSTGSGVSGSGIIPPP